MRSDAPAGINEFFIALKNMWLERTPNLNGSSNLSQISQVPAVNIENKSHSDNSAVSRAEIASMIKSQLALVPTNPPKSTQPQKTQPDPNDYLRVPDKYMPERPPDGYGVNSERFINANLINPTPSTSQIMESLANDLYKKLSDMFSVKPVQSKNKDTSTDDIDEITKGMSKLSLNLAKMAKEVNAVKKSSQHHCSNCNRTGHNSRKCTRKKRSKSRSKKRGSVNKVALDSGSDTNSSDNDSSDNNSDSEETSSKSKTDINVNITHLKKK